MKPSTKSVTGSAKEPRTAQQAGARIVILVLACLLLGVVVSALWFSRLRQTRPANEDRAAVSEPVVVLSDATRAVLKRIETPIEIRFYSLLDPASLPASLPAFAGRVDRLLTAYERDGGGKVHVARYDASSDTNADLALKDGIRPFNRDVGGVCYLGLTVTCQQQKESFPQLFPEWEPALESDLSRAIERLIPSQAPAASVVAAVSPAGAGALEEVKRAIPNFATVSVEEGTRILRTAALKEFKAAADEMQSQLGEAQKRLSEAQLNGSPADQQAAMKQLQQLQSEQAEKLRQLAARSQAQIEALKQLKAAAR